MPISGALHILETMAKYRVLSSNWRMDGSRGLRIGRIVPSRGVDVAAWPVHLATPDADRTLCGLDAKGLREFKQDARRVAQHDRCEQCFDARA